MGHQPFYDSSSGAKLIISSESAKWNAFFLTRFYSECLRHIANIRYHISFLNSSGSGRIPSYSLGNSDEVR